MLAGSTAPYGWAICVGGSVKLAEAMAAYLRAHGGEVRVDATVRQIEVSDGARAGRRPRLGRAHSRRAGRSSRTSIRSTRSSSSSATPSSRPSFRPLVERWRYDVMSMFCCYLALDAPVRWKAAAFDPRVQQCFAVSMCETLDLLDDNASDCRLGIPPRNPGLFSVHPSLFEPSLAPEGKEACFVEQIAPYELREGGSRRLGGAEGPLCGLRPRPLARVPPQASSRRTWSAATSRARSTSSGSCRA